MSDLTKVIVQGQPPTKVIVGNSNQSVVVKGIQGMNVPVSVLEVSGAAENLFVQNAAPTNAPSKFLWIQTGLGSGSDFTVWFEDGT